MTDSRLRGLKLEIPKFHSERLPETLQHVNGYSNLQTFFPTLGHIFRLNKFQSEEVTFNLAERILSIDCSGAQGLCSIHVKNNDGDLSEKVAFLKVTHLLEPVKWMQGKYSLPKEAGLPWHNKTWTTAWHKLQDPWNQAYVETLASYALHKLRESDTSPHFNLFYGAYCAKADTYRYNIDDNFDSYRNAQWFWKGNQNKLYSLNLLHNENPEEEVPEEIKRELLTPPEFDEEDGEEEEEEDTLEDIEIGEIETADLESLHSDAIESVSDVSEEEDEEEDEEEEGEYSVYADIPNFPVMLILTENNVDTMDSLLNAEESSIEIGSEEWETQWSAWIFQVIAAVCAMQKILGMTHNDLHTNNIVWSPTEKEFLYYRNNAGQVWKIPTYGKIFRLIDFGRSIFTINGKMFVSDDFRAGNDAAGQYSFPPLFSKPRELVKPNPSFDLSRLAVSLFEAIFPTKPEEAESRRILSEEEGLIVRETVSPLYNMLWNWMVDDEDKNILMNPDSSERFPNFDLYIHIAAHCKNAFPDEQIYKEPFSKFVCNDTEIPIGTKPYSLFY